MATAGNTQVGLTWNAVSGATSYTVKWSTTSGGGSGYLIAQAGLTATSYTHTGRTNGTTYFYVVTASGVGGEGPSSAQVSATPSAPAFSTQDIGAITLPAGTWNESGGVHTVQGGGADIGNAADEFRFIHQQLTGNGSITARVNSFQCWQRQRQGRGHDRQNLNANSPHLMAAMPPGAPPR